MKKTITKILAVTILLFINSIGIKAQTDEILNNEKVIQLSKIGLQPSVIVNKIKSSKTNFDVSTDALINLNKEGVSSDVINEMMKISGQKASAEERYIDSKDPNVMHKSGVYYFDKSDVNSPLKRIQVIRTKYQTSSGGYGGIHTSSTNAIISGEASHQQIPESNPIFYFYFPQEKKSDDWFSSSPNEFALVATKVIPKKGIRLFKVGGSSSVGFSSNSSEGVPEKMKIPFDFKEISEGIYQITIKSPLEYGEYCFTYANNTSMVFDFGIQRK